MTCPPLRLPDPELHRVQRLFGAEHLGFVLAAMVAGNTPAQVWVDDPAAPATALIWDGGHCVYLAGAVDQPSAWRELFGREIPGSRFLKVYVDDAIAATVFAGDSLPRLERVLYRWTGPRQACAPLPGGYQISSIGDRFADLATLANFADLAAEIESCWPSADAFRRAGFGFAAHDAETIVCWCTAEYVSDTRCGIGVETVEPHRGRGLATATAAVFVEHCAGRGLTPHWDAWSTNLPSIAVAEKLGFHRVETYPIRVLHG